jgi:hypothetical protein
MLTVVIDTVITIVILKPIKFNDNNYQDQYFIYPILTIKQSTQVLVPACGSSLLSSILDNPIPIITRTHKKETPLKTAAVTA